MDKTEQVSLCIIDDIKSVVEGLSSLEWEEKGVILAGKAYNGEDGLMLIKEMKPDIIITDIRMPKMDGLSMLRAVLELNHACKIILISSYTDFDYARQAVKLGAFDFVVKPFTEEDIMTAVLKAREAGLQERARLLNEKEMERKLRESIPLLQQEYMELLLSYPTSWDKASNRWEFLGLSVRPEAMAVLLMEIDGFQERMEELSVHQIELARFTLQNIVEETMREYASCIVYRSKENRFVAVVNVRDAAEAAALAERCCDHIGKYSKFTISVGIGGVAESVSGLPESRRQAEWALAHHLYTSGNSVISYGDVVHTDQPEAVSLEYKDELLLALRSGNGEKAVSLLKEMAEALKGLARRPSPDYLLSLYEELAASAMRTFHELGFYSDIKVAADRFKAMQRSSGVTLAALQQQMESLCRDGADLVRRGTLSEGQTIIYKSMEYLSGQLGREVTVTECAAQVHLSASYFSILFKKVTGMTLTQYMTSERIRKAKAMLIDGVPVQEIAFAVGYEERRYFSDMFKRSTGMTPSEFRESYHSDEVDIITE
ncbi:DNA-binding response regulator [Paenibacillus sp. FSL H8-0548]|uniref:response regulator n=1 Tax=Paenibacillus sp. FSL H8-0548 TaxID=1920422 RepID=UPI00096D89A3|nr:response regulator [Paenibacillus sp. FSL H8-0548]OMF27615.1 DNA-binding response regulator [Paenibacillus sp. FSL H8-0548]